MGNEEQSLLLFKNKNENSIQTNLEIKSRKIYKRLKSSPITFNQLNLNLHLVKYINKFSETNLKDICKNSTTKQPIKRKSKDDYNLKNSLNNIENKKVSFLLFFNEEIKKTKARSLSAAKSQQNKNIFGNILKQNKKKENQLKAYIQNNNELLMSEEEFKTVYQLLKRTVKKNKFPVKEPVAITLGGQPGAGKSNIYHIARKRFSNNIVELDCDAFRVYHPYYKEIKNIFGKDDAIKTNPFVFKAVDLLIEELSNEKYNLIMESSLNSPNSALDNGKNLPPKGYKVELQIMATPKQISWQGTIDRYNKELKNGGSPRAVSKEFHDKVVQNICKSLDTVKKSGLMSNILIYDRNKNCLYDMKKDKNIDPCLLLYCIINGLFISDKFYMLMAYFIHNCKKVF